MKKNQFMLMTLLSVILVSASGCEVIGGIFKAGMWTGIIVIVLIVALILYLVGRGKK